MKTALAILGVVLLIIGGVLFYESRNTVSTFEPTPLRVPLPIVAGATVQKSFTPDLTEKYELNLDFQKPVTPLTIGTFMKEMQSIDVAWTVSAGGKSIASVDTSRLTDYSYGESFRLLFKSAGRMVASLGLLLLLVAAILARKGR